MVALVVPAPVVGAAFAVRELAFAVAAVALVPAAVAVAGVAVVVVPAAVAFVAAWPVLPGAALFQRGVAVGACSHPIHRGYCQSVVLVSQVLPSY